MAGIVFYAYFWSTKLKRMKTYKQRLTETHETYSSDDHEMEVWFSTATNTFCIRFNGELHTYKTWGGCVAKRHYFIEKYNLTKEE